MIFEFFGPRGLVKMQGINKRMYHQILPQWIGVLAQVTSTFRWAGPGHIVNEHLMTFPDPEMLEGKSRNELINYEITHLV